MRVRTFKAGERAPEKQNDLPTPSFKSWQPSDLEITLKSSHKLAIRMRERQPYGACRIFAWDVKM